MDRGRRLIPAVIALGSLLLRCPSAFTLDTSLDTSQYAHTAWKVREGFSKGSITSIAQTRDGYLWLGTEFGLLRFDGVRTVPWQPPAGEHLPSNYIRSLVTARDGTLWIGTAEGLASWKDGKLTLYSPLAGEAVDALLEDHQGTIWAGGQAAPMARLCSIQAANDIQCFGEDGSFGQHVNSLYEDRAGNLWVGALTGLWRWKPGPPKLYPMPASVSGVQGLIEGGNGSLLIAISSEIRQLIDGRTAPYALPLAGAQFTPRVFLRDRNGGLWIGTTSQGLVHVHQGRTDEFAQPDGLSGDFVEKLFEDREGNIWVVTLDGLDRFREFAVPTISVKQGLSNATVESVLAAADGSVWLGTVDGLNRLENGQITVYRKRSVHLPARNGLRPANATALPGTEREITDPELPDDAIESLFQDEQGQIWVSTHHGLAYFKDGRFTSVNGVPGGVHSFAGDSAGNLWISQNRSLFCLFDGRVVGRIPWTALGHNDPARALAADPLQGGLWLGFRDGGVAYFRGNQIRASYSAANGLGKGHLRGLRLGRDGTLWAVTEGGLSRVKDGRVVTLTSNNGLPCDEVHWVLEDNDHYFWLYLACGLVRIAGPELQAWATVADKNPNQKVQVTVFDSSDGVRSHATTTGYSPSVAKSADGKIWFLPWDGVSVLDPRRLAFNRLPPLVQIEQVVADRKLYRPSSDSVLLLPPLIHNLQIDYTALSFVAPEKVLFRFKLDGRDRDWQEVSNRRQAFYNDLSPGDYRFRVAACNNSGVWNQAGASLDFSVAPAYYQTTWFRIVCITALLALLWAVYQLRVRQLARQFNIRLEARVAERTRIARELHDTLLQSFHGLLFRFQAARNLLPRRTEEAIQALDGAIARTEQAIAESREAIQDIRSQPAGQGDLPQLLTSMGKELATSQDNNGDSPIFRMTVEGERKALSPVLQDEVYRIARELLRNAFHHARAHRIEAEIRYDHHLLRLRIRDDGSGIDPKVLAEGGRAGHWGLLGARERAQRIGARLDFWSEAGAGTEVQLTVPAAVAYEKSWGKSRFRLFRKTETHEHQS